MLEWAYCGTFPLDGRAEYGADYMLPLRPMAMGKLSPMLSLVINHM